MIINDRLATKLITDHSGKNVHQCGLFIDEEQAGWQKLCKGMKGLRQKVWTWTKILSPNICYFVGILRFVAIYALLEIFGQKMSFFGSKTVFLGQEVHYYMVYIAYFTELILQICDYAQKRRI